MFDKLKNEAINISPLRMPLLISKALEVFLKTGELEVLPVIKGTNNLNALYFKDCIPLILMCENGMACKSAIPVEITKEMPYLDLNMSEAEATASIQKAVHEETSIALVKGGRYLGMLPLKRLISFIHKNEIKKAITTNPLTGLPGNYSIEKEFERRVGKDAFVICYVDISNFKAYNDKYGFARGDEVIKYTGLILSEAGKNGFVGHIGGDDFVIMIPEKGAEAVLSNICKTFDNRVGVFYDEQHRKQGYITGKTRQGVLTTFPLMTLSLAAAVINEKVSFSEVSKSLAFLKQYLKQENKNKGGSQYAFDKRRATYAAAI